MRRSRSPEVISLSDDDDDNKVADTKTYNEDNSNPLKQKDANRSQATSSVVAAPAVAPSVSSSKPTMTMSVESIFTEISRYVQKKGTTSSSSGNNNQTSQKSKAVLIQKPLFYDQRLAAIVNELTSQNISTRIGSRVIYDRDSAFCAFAALGVSSQPRLNTFERYVKCRIAVVPKKPAHSFVFACAVSSKVHCAVNASDTTTHDDNNNSSKNSNKQLANAVKYTDPYSQQPAPTAAENNNHHDPDIIYVCMDDDGETNADTELQRVLIQMTLRRMTARYNNNYNNNDNNGRKKKKKKKTRTQTNPKN